MITRYTSFITTRQLAKVIKPSVGSFNDPAITSKKRILQRRTTSLAPVLELTLWDTRSNTSRAQCLTQYPAVVSFVSRQAVWSAPAANTDTINRRQSFLRIMHGSGRKSQRQWKTSSVSHDMALGAEMFQFARPADTASPFLVGMSAESRTVWFQSSIPRRSRIANKLAQILCQTPWRCHNLRRRQQVVPEPYRLGTSFQGTPLVTTYQIPSNIWRSLKRFGRPMGLLRDLFGSRGAKTRHSLSVSRRMVSSYLSGENHTTIEGIMQ